MFLRCPLPRRVEGEAERNAAIIMTYFHPFTLNPDWNTEDVPFLRQLCSIENSWHSSMLRWFDGRVLSDESCRYLTNFLVVNRVRPEEENMENSDDLLSDEEFVVDNSSFLDAISTRITQRGKQSEKTQMHADDIDLDDTCPPADNDENTDNTADAFKKAESYWSIPIMRAKVIKKEGIAMKDKLFATIKKCCSFAKANRCSANRSGSFSPRQFSSRSRLQHK